MNKNGNIQSQNIAVDPNGSTQYIKSDLLGVIATTPLHQYLTERGEMFETHTLEPGLAVAGTAESLIVTGNTKDVHFTYDFASTLPGLLEIWEGVSTDTDGSAVIIYNSNRNSPKTPTDITITNDPTVVTGGVLISSRVVGHTGNSASQSTGGSVGTEVPLILKYNTNIISYLPQYLLIQM